MANAVVTGGSSTQSRGKRPGKPCRTLHCSGAYEWLEDGRKILSWPMGQYGGLLGYPAYDNLLTRELVDDVLPRLIRRGEVSLGSYAPIFEQQLANKLALLYAPHLHSSDIGIRFFTNGTDACQAAVALARYATGHEAFISVGYHGGSSPTFAFKPQNNGILKANEEMRYDIEFGSDDLDIDCSEMACIIVEVPSVENDHRATQWLVGAMDDVTIFGGYSIFDDIVTGFRYAPVGALEYYSRMNYLPGQGAGRIIEWTQNIKADFICLGKALSTYGKVAALLGPADIMQALADKVFASYTYSDHPLGFADALWTLEQYEKHHTELYGELADNSIVYIGSKLKAELNQLFKEYTFPARCIGHPARSAIVAADDSGMLGILLARVVDERNVLLHVPNFVTLAHTLDHVDKTLIAVETVLKTWK